MAEGVGEEEKRSTLSMLVDNETGTLARVAGLLSGRGYNIHALTVAEVDEERGLSLITLVTEGTTQVVEQICAQLERLITVHEVRRFREGEATSRELALYKVEGEGDKRVEALRLADAFRARVVDASATSLVFELTGSREKVKAFRRLMEPLGLTETARTGAAALSRGPKEERSKRR